MRSGYIKFSVYSSIGKVTVTRIAYSYTVSTSSKTRYSPGCLTVYNVYSLRAFTSDCNSYSTSYSTVCSYGYDSIITTNNIVYSNIQVRVDWAYSKCITYSSKFEVIITSIIYSYTVFTASKTR